MSTDGQSRDPNFESQLESIPLHLETFDGPLDLLLHLIKKNEVNIYDIPIALITEQYLAYLSLMQELNLDLASEFLVTAATLIHIKSRQLLPRPEAITEDTGEEIDPRDALVQRLLDHQRFKAALGASPKTNRLWVAIDSPYANLALWALLVFVLTLTGRPNAMRSFGPFRLIPN